MRNIQMFHAPKGKCQMMLSLTPELRDALEAEAQRQRKSRTLLINQLLEKALQKRKSK